MKCNDTKSLLILLITAVGFSSGAQAEEVPNLTPKIAEKLAADAPPVQKNPWNHWEYGDSTLEFHGYARSSVGTDLHGHTPAMFKALGAQDKYRLGNETDTDFEAQLDYHYFLDGVNNPKSRYIEFVGMLASYSTNPQYQKYRLTLDDGGVNEAYTRLGNFLGDGVNVWAGRRYYDRRYINIIDHFWLDAGQGAQAGGGLEGLHVGGPGKLDLAVFEAKDENLLDRFGRVHASKDVDLYTYVLDARYRGIPTNKDGSVTLWSQLAQRQGSAEFGYQDENGYSLGGWHEQKNLYGGTLTTGTTFRQGAAMVQGPTNARTVREDQGYDLSNAYALEANTDYFYEPKSKEYGVELVGVMRREDYGTNGAGGGSVVDWLSAGVRPMFALNDNFSIATDFGIDYVNNEVAGRYGTLGKTSVALQFSENKGFNDRPVARLFVTAAAWSDGLKGAVGNTPSTASFGNDQSGMTFGFQVDHWW